MKFPRKPLVDCCVLSRPLDGETVCGDLSLIKPFKDGVLLAAIDGLGHGDAAYVAAQTARSVLNDYAQEPVVALARRCHEALTQTRGVVMTLASLRASDKSVTLLGVGNVECRLLRAGAPANRPQETALLHGGLIGFQLPALTASMLPLELGDVLVFATDGIHPRFADNLHASQAPRQLAQGILGAHFRGSDDALVMVARYLGTAHE